MYSNYLKVAFRNLLQYKFYSLLNISGLAVGLCVSLLLMFWIQDELSYDRFNTNIDTLYRIVIEEENSDQNKHVAITPAPLSSVLKEEIPEIIRSTRMCFPGLVLSNGEDSYNEQVCMADPDLFEMFDVPLIMGDPSTALSDPYSILLTEGMASKYFGDDNPVGNVLRVNNTYDFKVTGVLKDLPQNSSFNFEFLAPFEFRRELEDIDYWGAWRYTTFVQLNTSNNRNLVNDKVAGVMNEKENRSDCRLYLQPLKDIHLKSNLHYDIGGRGDIKYVWIFAALILFILAIASINFINLTTARSSKRAKEIGLRKVIGAAKTDILKQFLGESLITTIIALIIALVLVELLFPFFENLTGKHIVISYQNSLHLILGSICIVLFVGILSGVYPAVFLSSFQPVKILRKEPIIGGKIFTLRRILVVIQFALTVFFIIGTLCISGQVSYMKNKNLGFNKEHIIYIPLQHGQVEKYNIFKNSLLQNPDIKAVTAAFQLPTNIGSSPGEMDWEGKAPGRNIEINAGLVDYDYFETFNMEIVDGRWFSKEFKSDEKNAYVINEETAKLMGNESPIGKWFSFWDTRGEIIGVVKDFHSTPLQNKINPIVLKLDDYFLNYVFIKIENSNISSVLKSTETVWADQYPGIPFGYKFLDNTIDKMYRSDERVNSLFSSFTAITIIIAFLGLLGLAAYTTEQRAKEIGIRKIIGASVSNIVVLLTKEFLILIIIANAISWPFAYYAINHYLQGFAYHIEISWPLFAISGAITFVFALFTISFQTFKSANSEPLKALRYE
ncbi:MAG: FtsX-like permease family protein [candidate division Zixibacteria bacterium]|nr:FtsX-like permease family protein [candidate division Zixibacteria bacterium]